MTTELNLERDWESNKGSSSQFAGSVCQRTESFLACAHPHVSYLAMVHE
jgi:hypothetical protein